MAQDKKIDVGGLSVSDILKMNARDFRGVSTSNVKQITSRLVSAMNKRIVRLGKSEIGRLSPTWKAFEKRGKYSVKGLTRETTIQVFNRLKESLPKATSLSEFKKYRKELYNKLDLDFNGDLKTEKKFWELYNQFQEYDQSYANTKKGVSGDVIRFLSNDVDWKNKSVKDIKKIINKKIRELKGMKRAYKQESDYFEDEGN